MSGNNPKDLNSWVYSYVNMNRIISELRPVEALYLLNHAGKEVMDEENSLAATLGYLANGGYIEQRESLTLEDIGLNVTGKGKFSRHGLRPYEIDSLDALTAANSTSDVLCIHASKLLYTSVDFNFNDFMVDKGYFKTEQRKKGRGILKWDDTDYLPGEKYDQAIEELDALKKEVQTAISDKNPDKFLKNMSYAFPSMDFSDEFTRSAEDIVAIDGNRGMLPFVGLNALVDLIFN